jgi:hypothetical protein
MRPGVLTAHRVISFMGKTKKVEFVDRGFTAERAEPVQPGGPTHIRIAVQQYIVGIYQAAYIGNHAIPFQITFRDSEKANAAIQAMRKILIKEGEWTITEHGTEPRKET